MTPHPAAPSLRAKAPFIVAALLVLDSLHFVFARLLTPHLPPVVSVMFVMIVATLEMAVVLAIRGQIQLSLFRQNWRFFLIIGLLVAGSTNITYTAVAYIDPGTAAMLAQTSTLFSLGLSILWLRERLDKFEAIGAAAALLGVFVISFQHGDYLRVGSLLILASTLMYALHTAVVKRGGGEMPFANFFLFRVGSIAAFSTLFAVGSGKLVWPEPNVWLLLILVGTVDVVLSRTLYYISLRRLRMSALAVILTLSPAITILWSALLFDSRPTVQALIGGAAVIGGVSLMTARRKPPAPIGAD